MADAQLYNEAEFVAINITRLAVHESEAAPASAAIWKEVATFIERHGSGDATTAIAAIVAALARHHAAALGALASFQGQTVDALIEDFEQHKLEQIALEEDEGEDQEG